MAYGIAYVASSKPINVGIFTHSHRSLSINNFPKTMCNRKMFATVGRRRLCCYFQYYYYFWTHAEE